MEKRKVYTPKEKEDSTTEKVSYTWNHHRPSVYTHTHEEIFGGRLSQSEIEDLLIKFPYMKDYFKKG